LTALSDHPVTMTAVVSLEARVQGRQLARVAREVTTAALTIELAAERGDWETVHRVHDALVPLLYEYRLAYRSVLSHCADH
jgi:hypothetical protein